MDKPFDLTAELKNKSWAIEIPGNLLMRSGRQNYIGAAFAVRGTLYFRGAHTRAVREALCDCFDDFQFLMKPAWTWLSRESLEDGPRSVPWDKASPLRSLAAKVDEDDVFTFSYTSGEKPEDASAWLFDIYGPRGWEAKMGDDLAVIEFSAPMLFVDEHPLKFIQFFISCARRLKAEQGYAGYALNLSLYYQDDNEPTEAFISQDMPALDVGTAALLADIPEFRFEKIKTVSWLTLLNTPRLKQVGGLTSLQASLPASHFAFYDYGVGTVIQAGARPAGAGDLDSPKPANYVLLNHLLKPIRYETVGDLHGGSHNGEIRLTGWSADQWLKRLDVKDSELALYRKKLSVQEPLSDKSVLPQRMVIQHE